MGCLYILKHVLPSLAKLSIAFQIGSVNCGNIKPSIAYTKQKLYTITETRTPVKEFAEDFKTGGRRSSLKICVRETDIQQQETLLKRYISSLMNNIDARFESSLPVLEAFSVFDCMAVPSPSNKVEFQEYGEEYISTLAGHYFTGNETDEEEVFAASKMRAEWGKLKFDVHEWKAKVPKDLKDGKDPSKITTTTWTLQHLLQQPSYRFFYPMLTQLAECCLSLPVSNAWPERVASALKRIKTRLRYRLSNSMLQSLMQMSINGPPINSKETEDIIVKVWTLQKKRRKMPKPPTNTSQENTFEQMVEMVDAGVQASDQSEKAVAAKVFEEVEKL